MNKRQALLMSFALATSAVSGHSLAQSYPDRPIKLIVPFAPGGATDILGRLLAVALTDKLGQSVIVENKPGAGTALAAAAVAKLPADGYNLLLASSSTLTLNPVVRQNLGYDPVASFTPIGQVADMGLVLVANPNTPGTTLKDVLANSKAEPGKYAYGSFGAGSSVHFAGEMLKSVSGADLLHVPFNGSAPSLTALIGGQVQVAMDTVVASTPFVKSGKIKAIAVLSLTRSPLMPDVPTVAESGYPGFEMSTWFALMTPANLPPPIRTKLETALASVMTSPEIRKKLNDVGLIPAYAPGLSVRTRIEKDLPFMRAVAARTGLKVE